MAKIQNPQNEKGESLATNNTVNNIIKTRLAPVESSLDTIENKTIPEIKALINDASGAKLTVENLDDNNFTPIDTITNLNKIQFVGKYVNIVDNGDGSIRVYINEDNSRPQWDGRSVSLTPSVHPLYIYGVPSGAENVIGNKKYDYVNSSHGIPNIVLTYNGSPFTLLKGDYNIEVSYKLNGKLISKSISLVNEINSNLINETTPASSQTIEKDNFTLKYCKLGYDMASQGKTPGNLEVDGFSYTIPAGYLQEGEIKNISISFKPDSGISSTLKSELKIYLWTTDVNNNTPSGDIKITENKPNTIHVSGLEYHDGSTNTRNKITASISGNNLANGALERNTIKISAPGLTEVETQKEAIEKPLTSTSKSQKFNVDIEYRIPTTFTNWKSFKITADYPGVYNFNGASIVKETSKWNIHPVYNSNELNEYFISENERRNSDWSKWDEKKALVAGEAVVQNGNLYHTKGSYLQGGVDELQKKDWKSLENKPCSFYRIFKDPSAERTVNDFYISGINSLLGKEDDVEIIVQPYTGSKWSDERFIANKYRTIDNDGLASSDTVNGKIKCSLPSDKATYGTKGIKMEIKIKNIESVVPPISITF